MVSHHTHPPPPYSDLHLHLPSPAPSAPASVTSARSHTRRHRHARTHHGGSSAYLPQNEFPIFSHTGDVEIVISTANGRRENRYLLHRLILSQCSGFFEAGTGQEWSRGIEDGGGARAGAGAGLATIAESSVVSSSSRASSSDRRPSLSLDQQQQQGRRWRYSLDWRGARDEDTPMLVQQPASAPWLFGSGSGERPPAVHNKPIASHDGFFRSMTNFSALNLADRVRASEPSAPADEVLTDYDNLFRTMYQYPPLLDSVNIATAYTQCKALLHLADMYDALEVVGSRVDHHLLRFGARLLKQIAKYPPSYLRLGYLARSRTIFTEALVHVVGQWPLAQPQLRGQVDVGVMDLIEDKADELEEMKTRIEAKLWRLSLTTTRGERVTPANEFLTWLALSLFRQWLADNSTPSPQGTLKAPVSSSPGTGTGTGDPAPARASSRSSNDLATQRAPAPRPPPAPPPPNSDRIYRLLASSSPSAYLSHDELKRFLKATPDLYTRDNLRRFERRVAELKLLARDAVKPLMRNSLDLDLAAFGPAGLGYLTCASVGERDLLWED